MLLESESALTLMCHIVESLMNELQLNDIIMLYSLVLTVPGDGLFCR